MSNPLVPSSFDSLRFDLKGKRWVPGIQLYRRQATADGK